MKIKWILLLFLLLSNLAYSQKDSVFIIGFASQDCALSKSINSYCSFSYDKQILSGTLFTIVKAFYCNSSNGKERIYEVYVNKNPYFIKADYVNTEKGIFDYVQKIKDTAKFRLNAIDYSQRIEQIEKSKYEKFFATALTKGVALVNFNYYKKTEYSNSISVGIKIYNPTKKVIKYITFNMVALNPVGDRITEFGKNAVSVKGVGPLDSFEFGEYEFEDVWFSKVFESAKIISMKVQYTDGSIKTITDVKSVEMPDSVYRYLIQ